MMNANDFKNKLEAVIVSSDVVELTKSLIRIPSYSGLQNQETQTACFINRFFEFTGVESEVIDIIDGRSNVMARLPGDGGGRNLLLTGHLDTVPAYGMENAFSPKIKNDKLFGRGAVDMKGPVAAMMCAMKAIKSMELSLSGDVVFAGVIDEEERSAGTIHLIKNMPDVDAVIVGEPTDFKLCKSHRGVEWLEFHIEGKTVHGGNQSEGLNAVTMAAKFIRRLEEVMPAFIEKSNHPLMGRGSWNIGTINGGTQPSTVAGDCRITLDRRWLPCESHGEIMAQLKETLDSFAKQAPGYKFHMKIMDSSQSEPGYTHDAMETGHDEEIVKITEKCIKTMRRREPEISYFPAWTDGGLIRNYGHKPTIIFAPGNLKTAHSSEEHIEIDSLKEAVLMYAWIIYQFCK
jgi:acetylornithine deacetylase/succinyl-diaminopimelate desuccinylase